MPFLFARISAASVFVALSVAAQAQSSAAVACQQDKGRYQCDQTAFMRSLSAAKTVAVETRPFDSNGQQQLGKLATQLGKTVASTNTDLIFRLERLNPDDTIYYGPNSRDLAALRVYSCGPQGSGGVLIWVEIYNGQPDMPWPTIVYEIIQQFKANTR